MNENIPVYDDDDDLDDDDDDDYGDDGDDDDDDGRAKKFSHPPLKGRVTQRPPRVG